MVATLLWRETDEIICLYKIRDVSYAFSICHFYQSTPMLDYLNIPYQTYVKENPRLVYKEWDYLKNNIHHFNNKFIDQSYRFPYWVASNHILNQFILTMDIDYTLDAFDYYDAIKERGLFVSTDFGMTSPLSKGVIHQGAFYGDGKEMIIAHSGTHRPTHLENHWDRLIPVTVLRHGYKSFDFQPIVKADKVSPPFVNVILIDIVSLLFQYRGFRLKEDLLKEIHPDRDHTTIASFLSRYPLNHMRYSHNDYVLFNRLLEDNSLLVDRSKFLPLPIPNFDRQIVEFKKDIIQKTGSNLWDFLKVLSHTPSLYHGNHLNYLLFKDHDINRQNVFSYLYAILPHLVYAITMPKRPLNGSLSDYLSVNSSHLSVLKKIALKIDSDGILNSSHLQYVKRQVQGEWNHFKDIIHGRV